MTRDFYKPQNPVEIKAIDCSAVAYLGTGKFSGKVCAVGFSGKRNKPDFNYTFRDETQARKYIAEHAAGVLRSEKQRAEWAAKRESEKCRTALDVWNKAQKCASIQPKDAAICLRAVLAAKFPGVKFSVTSDRSLRVSWTDGPSYKTIDAIAHNYSFEGFDGMVDCRYSIRRWLTRDGVMTLAETPGHAGGGGAELIGSPHGGDAVLVNSGPDFVFCHRSMSFAEELKIAQAIATKYGIKLPEFATQRDLQNFTSSNRDAGEYLSTLIHREEMQSI